MNIHNVSRRKFIVTSATAAGGMMLGFHLPAQAARLNNNPWELPTDKEGQEVNAWLAIDPDGTVTIRVGQSEMGNGPFTAMPMIVAEELHVDWKMVRAAYADGNRYLRQKAEDYQVAAGVLNEDHQVYRRMGTGGSGAVRRSRTFLQQAGASARERLKEAAAQAWGVARADVTAKDSVLSSGSRTGTFAEFATAASTVTLDVEPVIKTPDQYTLMGQSVARLDSPLKINGSATYGIDVRLPGMVYAAVRANPVPYGGIDSYDADAIMGLPGVIQVGELKPGEIMDARTGLQPAVYVVADSYTRALSALDQMPVKWSATPNDGVNSADLFADAHAALSLPGAISVDEGDTAAAIAGATTVVEADYEAPYESHACMEPFNCTVNITDGRADAYGSFQNPPGALAVVADQLGMDPINVFTHTTFLGGGLGRRSRNDEPRQAAEIARQVGRPVKMVWTREEDMMQNKMRPMAVGRFKAGLGPDGMPVGWSARVAGHSINAHLRPERVVDGLDNSLLAGIRNHPYSIPNQFVDVHVRNSHIPVHYWRSVNASQNVFMGEQFIDEMAQAGGHDPMQFRLDMVKDLPDWTLVLNTLREKSGWTTDLPPGTGMGIGIAEEFGTVCGQVATVTVTRRGQLRVDKVVAVADCGHLCNPIMAEGQVEGAIVTGLSAGLAGEITIRDGKVVEDNFDTFKVLRMNEMPVIETHFALTGGDKWGGLGEPPLPPVMAAVANAIFYATGKRARQMPIVHTDLSWG
jgi:isoquinoline 1-oxidoreductase beta subunit